MRYREFKIVEALKPSQYRDLVKGWNRQRYADIFLNPKYKHDRKGYRVYLPIETTQQEQPESSTQTQIERFLDQNGFDMVDYVKGIVFNREKKQNIKIGKVLNKLKAADLLNAFNVDKSREATQAQYVAVISRHPYDIAGQSTGRGWRSCMNLEDGINRHYVPLDIREGTLVGYVTRSNDLDLKNPVGRISIKPFVDILGKPQIYFGIEDTVYGTRVPGFVEAVRAWVDEVNRAHELDDVAILKFHPDLYRDSSLANQRYVTGKKLDREDRENLSALSRDPRSIFRINNPNDSELAVAIQSDSGNNIFRRLMSRDGFQPSSEVQRAAVARNSENIFLLLDAGIKVSDDVVVTAARRNSDTLISLIQRHPDLPIPDDAYDAAVRRDPSNLTFFDIDKISADTIMQSLGYPPNLDILFKKSFRVNRQHIVKALDHGYSNAERLLKYSRTNNIDVDNEIIEAVIKKHDYGMVEGIFSYNRENLENALSFGQEEIKKLLISVIKDRDYRRMRRFLEIFSENDLMLDDVVILEIVKKTKSAHILNSISQDISEKLAKACLEYNGEAIRYIQDPDADLQRKAVSKTPAALRYIDNPDPEAVKLGLVARPDLIQNLKNVDPSYFTVIARHHMPNVRWDLGGSDLFPSMSEYIGMMEDTGLDEQEIQKNVELAVASEPYRIVELTNYGGLWEFLTDNVINSAAGKNNYIQLIPRIVKTNIMPPIKSMQLELKSGNVTPERLMRHLFDLDEDFFDTTVLKKLLTAVNDKTNQARLILHAYSYGLLSGDQADPKMINFALKNIDGRSIFWALNSLFKRNIPMRKSYIKTAFSKEYDSMDLGDFMSKNPDLAGMEKEVIVQIFENATDLQDAVGKLLSIGNSLIREHADEETWLTILKRWPDLINLAHMYNTKTPEMINAAYEAGGPWEPLSLGDTVRATNPKSKPRFRIEKITKTGYVLSLNGEEQGEISAERVHRANGITPPKGYKYPKKDDEE